MRRFSSGPPLPLLTKRAGSASLLLWCTPPTVALLICLGVRVAAMVLNRRNPLRALARPRCPTPTCSCQQCSGACGRWRCSLPLHLHRTPWSSYTAPLAHGCLPAESAHGHLLRRRPWPLWHAACSPLQPTSAASLLQPIRHRPGLCRLRLSPPPESPSWPVWIAASPSRPGLTRFKQPGAIPSRRSSVVVAASSHRTESPASSMPCPGSLTPSSSTRLAAKASSSH